MKGLLDTGTSISLLERGCGVKWRNWTHPCDGTSMITTTVVAIRPILSAKCGSREEEVIFYMWPDLHQEQY